MSEYNFTISFEIKFPQDWIQYPIMAIGRKISPENYDKCFHLAIEFMKLFDLRLLRYLKVIYFLEYMQLYGKEGWGGTRTKNSIYCTYKGYYTDYDVLRILVEEFSSVLWLNNPFTKTEKEQWYQCLPIDFKYYGTGIEVLGEKDLLKENENLFNKGFLNTYAMSSLENDLNQIFVYMFLKKDELNNIIENNELIKRKVKIVKEWLTKIILKLL